MGADKVEEELTKAAQDQIKAVYDDSEAEINGRTYVYNKMMFGERRAVFAYTSMIAPKLKVHDLSFLDDDKFKHIEKIINRVVTYDGMTLSKLPEHFNQYTEDYVQFIIISLSVISYPFQKGGAGA